MLLFASIKVRFRTCYDDNDHGKETLQATSHKRGSEELQVTLKPNLAKFIFIREEVIDVEVCGASSKTETA